MNNYDYYKKQFEEMTFQDINEFLDEIDKLENASKLVKLTKLSKMNKTIKSSLYKYNDDAFIVSWVENSSNSSSSIYKYAISEIEKNVPEFYSNSSEFVKTIKNEFLKNKNKFIDTIIRLKALNRALLDTIYPNKNEFKLFRGFRDRVKSAQLRKAFNKNEQINLIDSPLSSYSKSLKMAKNFSSNYIAIIRDVKKDDIFLSDFIIYLIKPKYRIEKEFITISRKNTIINNENVIDLNKINKK